MKICVKEMRRKQIGFWAIFEATGEKINKILRESEPQTHDKWDANNVEDEEERKRTRRCINQIDNWIEEEIGKLLYVDDSEEVDVEGLDMFLIDDEDDEYEKHDQNEKDIFDNRENNVSEEEKIESNNKIKKVDKVIDKTDDEENTDGQGDDEGNVGGKEGKDDVDIRNGEGKHEGDNNESNLEGQGKEYRLINLPFIGTPYDDNKKIQKLILRSNGNLQNMKILLYKVGDSGENEPLRIRKAMCKGVQLETEKNVIKDLSISGVTSIDIELEDNRKYIMEVKVYVQC